MSIMQVKAPAIKISAMPTDLVGSTFFGAAAVVSIRGRALPGWLGWSAAVLALLDLSVGLYSGLAGVNASTPSGPFGPAVGGQKLIRLRLAELCPPHLT
jgi:hypothetical protein